MGCQQPPERGLPLPPGGEASVPEDGPHPRHGLDIRGLILLGDHQPGPLPPRGAGHQSAGHGGLHPVQAGQPRLPLPGRQGGPGPGQRGAAGPGAGPPVDQGKHHHVWRRPKQNHIVFR